MWFRMPKGASRVTVERQEFSAEAKGSDGAQYFRAPAHFAPKILAIPGFTLAGDNLPTDAPGDLATGNPASETAINELTASLEAQKTEIAGLRADLIAARSQIEALTVAKKTAEEGWAKAEKEVAELKEELEDVAPAASAKSAPKGK